MATAKKTPSKKTPAKKVSTAIAVARKVLGPRNVDAKLIAATQKWEVSYEATKSGHSAAKVKAAVEALGHSRVKVRKVLDAAAAPMVWKKAGRPAD